MTAPIPLFRVHMPESAPAAVASVLHSGQLMDGEPVRRFEAALARYLGFADDAAPRVVSLSDLSGALTVALHLAGVGHGDDVLVAPMVCTASTMPIANLGAKPVWCDVDPLTGMVDPADVERRITPRTRALLVYHWSGDVADMEALTRLARARGIAVVEDASDAFGAEMNGRKIGNGDADFAVLSFRATKQINCAEGAALVCRAPAHADAARRLRRYGIDAATFRNKNGDLNPRSDIAVAGWNFALPSFNAAIGNEQWPHVERLMARYRENGAWYDDALAGVAGVHVHKRRRDAHSAFWTYSLCVDRRDAFVDALANDGIVSQRLHVRNDAYSCFASSTRPSLPGVDAFDASCVSIPCGWWVGPAERERVVARIRAGW